MKASELRIGNYLEIDKPITNRLIIVDAYHIKKLKQDENFFKPIPLTEEWLLKLGFSNKGDKGKLRVVLSGKLGYINGRTYYNSWAILESQPKYVHQLQNLYFALTGQELTIGGQDEL